MFICGGGLIALGVVSFGGQNSGDAFRSLGIGIGLLIGGIVLSKIKNT